MNSLTDIPSEYHCHRRFYQCIWGEVSCKYCSSKRINYEYCPVCKKKYSVKADTKVFSYCNLSFRQIIALIWCWQHKCSIGEIAKIAGVSYPTVNRWIKRLRASLEPVKGQLEGCEVDGSFFGKKRFGQQKLVIGAIDQRNGQIRLKIIRKRDRHNAENFIKQAITPGSMVLTDGFTGYNELASLGYEWLACNHSKGFFGPTNHIENLCSVIKRTLRYVYRDLSFNLNDLALILREFENRYNNPDLFYNVDSYLKTRDRSGLVW